MEENIFLEQSRRDKSSVEQLTPYKRSAVWGRFAAILLLAVLITACSKPEQKELAGSWRWKATTGGIGGWCYTPETEGFNAEIVFKGGTFTFYKDGEKVASGTYRIDYNVDETIYINKGGGDEPFYSWFRFHIPPAQVQKISDATNGTITFLMNPTGLIGFIGYSEAEGQVFSLCDDAYDGFCHTFVKN